MATFNKRTFASFSEFREGLGAMFAAGKDMRNISPAFRERLMLAVIAVNQCRYCSFVHTRTALKTGVSKEEVEGLCAGVTDNVPEEERVAVLYAQHWAETKGSPEADAVARLDEAYPPEAVAAINATIKMINFNNLCGNTFDRVLHFISFGLLGGGK